MDRRKVLVAVTAALGSSVAGCLENRGSGNTDMVDAGDGNMTDGTGSENPNDDPDDHRSNYENDRITETRFDVLGTDPRYEISASVRFMVDEVLVSGTIWGNNSCYTARLGEVVIDDSLLLVCVESYEDRGEDELCMEADYGIDYEAVFKFDGELPTTVTVEYNGQEITSEQRK